MDFLYTTRRGNYSRRAIIHSPSMAKLPDEAVSVGSSLKKAKKAIQDVLDTENYNLSLAVSGSISTFSKLMKSKKLISVDVTRTVQSEQFEAIMHDYKAAIKLKQDLKSLEEHCSLLLEILDDLGGPATDATNVLRNKLKIKIKEVTGVSFLSDSSDMLPVPSIPPPRGNRSNSDGLIQSSIKHLSDIEQSQSDIGRSQSDGHLECKTKALSISKLSSVTEEPSSAAATSGNLDQHFSGIGGAGSPSRPSTLTTCTQEVANQTNVDSGISFTAGVAADDRTPPPSQADATITSPGAPDNYNVQTPITTTDSENTASSGMHIVPSNHVHSSTVSGNEKATLSNTTNGIGKKNEPDGNMQPTQASMDDEQATSYNEIVSSSHNANIRPAACLPQLKTAEAHSTSSNCNHVEQICEKDRQIKILEKECRKLEKELETIKCEKDDLVKCKDAQIQKVERAFKSKVEQMTRDENEKIQEIEEQLEKKNEKLQEAKAKLLEARKEICDVKKEKEEELKEVKKEFKEYKKEKCNELQEVKCELKEVKTELKGELQESKKELKEMKKEKNDEVQEIKKELKDTKNQLREAKQKLEAAERELEAIKRSQTST